MIAYYITSHGYGHGSRSCDIIAALREAAPGQEVTVVSRLPVDFLESRLGKGGFEHRRDAFDVGLVQLDSVRCDVEATLELLLPLHASWERKIAEEVTFLQEAGVDLVVSDIPAIPLQAAQAAGVPHAAVGNFGWDWIYAAYRDRDPAWGEIVDAFARAYAATDLLLRLPFSEPMAAFPRQMDVPVVARPGASRRAEMAHHTGADPEKPWVLLSFTSLELEGQAIDRVSQLTGYEFFTVLPLAWQEGNVHGVNRHVVCFADALATCDAVISKPGFGIVSECVVNRKPLLYVERTDFLEYPILVEAIERYLQHVHLPAADLYAGTLAGGLERLFAAPEPAEHLPANGAEIAARALVGLLNGRATRG